MNEIKSEVENLVQKELESANQKFPMFRSDHEGAAVIVEEIEEAEYEFECIKDRFQELWRAVKCNTTSEWISEINTVIVNRAVNLAIEAIQVAAMSQKFIDSQKVRNSSGEFIKTNGQDNS